LRCLRKNNWVGRGFRFAAGLLPAALLLGGLADLARAQNPTIVSVENAASNVPTGLPNAGIALGSMFVIKGTNLGPSTVVVANTFPLQTTLGGTSISVSIGGRSVPAIPYYTLDRQLAAILPSTVFAGAATMIVSYGGRSSTPFPFTIVTSNVAVYTLSSTGTGQAVAALGDNTLVSPTNAPNPGEVVVIYANGLGPVTFDETQPAQAGDLLTTPLEVFVAGLPAAVLYKGRNPCCSSVDQINIRLPDNVTGCIVPITLRMVEGVSSEELSRLISRPGIAIGSIALIKNSSTVSTLVPGVPPINSITRTDVGTASFFRYPTVNVPTAVSLLDVAAPGSCTLTSFSSATAAPSTSTFSLDAGDSLTLTGVRGDKVLRKAVSGTNLIYESTLDDGANYLVPSEYTVRGTGGGGVGTFSAGISTPPAFAWTNATASATVTRLNGLTINWTGGDPNGLVEIGGTSSIASGSAAIGASFVCIARGSTGSFNVPPAILLALPPSGTVSGVLQQGTLRVRSSTSRGFSATGIDTGSISFETRLQQTVVYQ
jgi:uncharacterized protein (TIGR03437 family)